jgi:hypothetical protein
MSKAAKSDEKGTALATVGNYAMMNGDIGDLGEMIREVVGPNGINPQTDLDRVKVPSGGGTVWEVPSMDGVNPQQTIEGVIIHQHDARAYWPLSDSDTAAGEPPRCSSRDGVRGEGDPGGMCAECPHSAWDTGKKGRGQACKTIKMLYLATPDRLLPLALALPPTSIKAAKQYMMRLVSHGRRVASVVTRISLEQDKNEDGQKFSRARFESAGMLNEADTARMLAFGNTMKPALNAADIGAAVRDTGAGET